MMLNEKKRVRAGKEEKEPEEAGKGQIPVGKGLIREKNERTKEKKGAGDDGKETVKEMKSR